MESSSFRELGKNDLEAIRAYTVVDHDDSMIGQPLALESILEYTDLSERELLAAYERLAELDLAVIEHYEGEAGNAAKVVIELDPSAFDYVE